MFLPSSNRHAFFVFSLICLLFISPCVIYGKPQPKKAATPHRTRLVVSNIRTDSRQGGTVLSFRITQEPHDALQERVPILITTGVGTFHYSRAISGPHTDLAFALPDPPLQFVIDPGQTLKRELTLDEKAPTWARLLEAKEITVVVNPRESATYAPLLTALSNKTIVSPQQVDEAMLEQKTLLFLAADNLPARGLLGGCTIPQNGFSLEVHRNPLAPGYLVARAVSSSVEQTRNALQRLRQDRDFSSIRIAEGRVLDKRKDTSRKGQIYTLQQLPAGASTTALSNFSKITDRLASYRVVYAGEVHTSSADHLLQLRLIQALYKNHPDLAIGMEMFSKAGQKALDAYTLGDTGMTEKVFLKKSGYFKSWGYDFRLFRDIFTFARRYHIPVVALNIDRHIVSHIFKTGSTEALKPDQKRRIPIDRDLSLPGYADRLRKIQEIHPPKLKNHGTTAGFIKAQAVWDETMAQNITHYLIRHPGSHMVVLAGVEHIRKDSGIPPRVARRLNLSQASVVNITSQDQYDKIADSADYFFMESASPLPAKAKMGLVLEEKKKGMASYLEIDDFSPHGNAGRTGLKKHDILLAIDGNPVYDMDDVRIAMLDKKAGEVVTVMVKRRDSSSQKRKFLVKIKTRALHPYYRHIVSKK